MRLLILSGSDHLRFPTLLNHKRYAEKNGYRYRFDMAPVRDVALPYFHKLRKIADALIDTDWLFWIDDDAAFTQLDTSFEDLVPEMQDPDAHLIFCRSPINPQGGWTYLSSGNFLVRNSSLSMSLLERSREELLPTVRDWWDPARYGIFTEGDQDALVYTIETDLEIKRSTRLLEFTRFNTRPYHFSGEEDHFLVHFTNLPGRSKIEQMREFARARGQSVLLVPDGDLAAYGRYPRMLLDMVGEGE